MRAIIVGSLVLATATQSTAAPKKCEWSEKQQCAPGTGCKAMPITTYATIDLTAKRYSRCDRKGCDTYDANVSGGGAKTFFNVDVTARGMLMKISPEGRSTEVITLGNVVLISQGICR
jgi:hypothetical protein